MYSLKLSLLSLFAILCSVSSHAFIEVEDLFPTIEKMTEASFFCQDEEGGGIAFNPHEKKAWIIFAPDEKIGVPVLNVEVNFLRCLGCYVVTSTDQEDSDLKLRLETRSRNDVMTANLNLGDDKGNTNKELICQPQIHIK